MSLSGKIKEIFTIPLKCICLPMALANNTIDHLGFSPICMEDASSLESSNNFGSYSIFASFSK